MTRIISFNLHPGYLSTIYSMGNTFFAYLHRLEILAFFSAYPLLYAVVFFIAGASPNKNNPGRKAAAMLAVSYAFSGFLYLGLQCKNLSGSNFYGNLTMVMQQPYLTLWALCSMAFFVPALAKRPVLSLLHSLVFFFFVIKDVVSQFFNTAAGSEVVKNDMKMFTDSFLLQCGSLLLMVLIIYLLAFYRKSYAK
ncbi:MAG TPA: hypothetical protein VG738_01150 [Chitinophagaceae bacterium]|nr:hypothetical protein [Chitinophagaceae bacterium]